MEVRPVLRPFAIPFVFPSIPPTVRLLSQSAQDGLPAFSPGWTEPEKGDFRYCVSRISDISRENTMQLSADSFACGMHEDQEHWMHLHPKAFGRKENSAKLKKCLNTQCSPVITPVTPTNKKSSCATEQHLKSKVFCYGVHH
jgi:hypothetical protein